MRKVYQFFKDNPTFFLATTEGDQPRVRPFGAVAVFEERLYICTNIKKDVYQQMIANPKVELCGMDQAGGWLRVAATAVEDDRVAPRAQMLEENPSLKGAYSPEDGLFCVLWLENATATYGSFSAETWTETF